MAIFIIPVGPIGPVGPVGPLDMHPQQLQPLKWTLLWQFLLLLELEQLYIIFIYSYFL